MNRRTFLAGTAGALSMVMVSDTMRTPLMRNALWVWHQMPAAQLAALATKYRVGRLLVWVSPGFSKDPTTLAWLDTLAAATKSRRMTLDALCGDPSWVHTPEVAGTWAQEVRESKRFSRIHLDIEPHALPEWEKDSASLIEGLLLAIAMTKLAGMHVDVDIPSWYWTVATNEVFTADEMILQAADGIYLMSYQDHATKTLDISRKQMAAAAKAGKPAFIGVNVMAAPAEDPGSSLYGQSAATIRSSMNAVETGGARLPMFCGVAIHDATSLAQL